MSRRALIFGISGQDGAYLAQLLLAKGYEVCGASRDPSSLQSTNLSRLNIRNSIQLVAAQPKDFHSVTRCLSEFKPDEVYNLSGLTSVALSFEQPVECFESISVGTLHVLEAIRLNNRDIRFYNAGSSECFGNTNSLPADENTAFLPRSPYGVAKAAAFWQVSNFREAYDLFVCSGILFNHESPLRPERFVTKKIIAAAVRIAAGKQTEKLTLGNLNVARDWGWAPEYVDAMWRMLQIPRAEDFVIATGQTNPLKSFVAKAFEYVGLDWTEHVTTDPKFSRPTDIEANYASPNKAERILGWQATSKMNDVIKKMIQAEKDGNNFA